VLRRRVGAARAVRDRSCDGDDVDDVRRRAGFEEGQEGAEAPHTSEIVDAHHLLDSFRWKLEKVPALSHTRVVHEEVHGGMRLADAARDPFHLVAVGDVALLELGVELGRHTLEPLAAAGEQDAVPAAAAERVRDRSADSARPTRHDGHLHAHDDTLRRRA
jgi:hypothetical protein